MLLMGKSTISMAISTIFPAKTTMNDDTTARSTMNARLLGADRYDRRRQIHVLLGKVCQYSN